MAKTVLVSGGTGLIGKALTSELAQQGHEVIVLTRNPSGHPSKPGDAITYAAWDIEKGTFDKEAFQRADAIIHLAGANVAEKKWTDKRKKEIRESRVNGSGLIIRAIRETPNKIKTVVSASAIGWYGPDPRIPNVHPFNESDESYYDFLGETCKLWEESIHPVTQFGKRLVKLRTGIVLTNEGGAFPPLKKPIKFGAAGILGGGRQIWSWIHIHDLVRMYIMAVEDNTLAGTFNAVAPKPVSNKELVIRMAEILKGKFYIPLHVPTFVLRAALGEMSTEVLKSATVSCQKIRKAGFNFVFPSIESALNDLLKN